MKYEKNIYSEISALQISGKDSKGKYNKPAMKKIHKRFVIRSRRFYKTPIPPVLLYSAEAWALLSIDVATLRVFFDPVQIGDDFRIRYNSELYELLNDVDVCAAY